MINVNKVSREKYSSLLEYATSITHASTIQEWLTITERYIGYPLDDVLTDVEKELKLKLPIDTDYRMLESGTTALKVALKKNNYFFLFLQTIYGNCAAQIATAPK